MQINIHAHGLKLSNVENEYINLKMEKISTLAKRINDEASEIRVEINHDATKSIHEAIGCTITLFIPKDTLRAEAHGALVNEAVDLAKAKLIPQIDKYKEKFKK